MASIDSLGIPHLAGGALATSSQNTGNAGAGDIENLGKSEFLTLLVAQLQNQDPLNPLKNEEFVAQLATFSSLEQLMAIRSGIEQLVQVTDSQTGNSRTAVSHTTH
jgi:flagellar basal-body rod modification protein FlgD